MKFLKIPRNKAERIRIKLIEMGLLSKEYAVSKDSSFVFFPLEICNKYPQFLENFEIVEKKAKKRTIKHKNLKDALSGVLRNDELKNLITSFDVVGDLAIVEIPEALECKEKAIGKELLNIHKNLKGVYKKCGPMKGKYRVRQLLNIAGENKTETIHSEHGCKIKLDISKVYFSVRLSNERKRIASLVQPKEKIIVMFAGVGPFALIISKKHSDSEVVAIELNPCAVDYLRENADMNKSGNIIIEEGDVHDIVLRNYRDFADRIVMPLPKTAHEFLDAAFASIKNGGTIHFYTIVGSRDALKEALGKVSEKSRNCGIVTKLESWRVVRPYSPDLVQIVLDLKVNKNQEQAQ